MKKNLRNRRGKAEELQKGWQRERMKKIKKNRKGKAEEL